MNEGFILDWYDEEEDIRIQCLYEVSNKGYCYETYNDSNGISCKKRISEKAFISAFETYINA